MNLTGDASGGTSTDASDNYSFGGLANGNYTLTPSHTGYGLHFSFLSVTVSGANVTGQSFTWQSAGTGIAIDTSVSNVGASASATIATPTFPTIAGNELLLAFVATEYVS